MSIAKTIVMSLYSTRDFEDSNLAELLIQLMSKYPQFYPELYGNSNPIKEGFSKENMQNMIDLWMNTKLNGNSKDKRYKAGDFLAKRRKNCNINYFISWEKSQNANFNLVSLYSESTELSNEKTFSEFMMLCIDFIEIIKPEFGEVGISDLTKSQPINLKIRCPELKWMVIFGEPYIKMFGRQKLISAPVYKTHNFTEHTIGLQLVESIYSEVPKETRYNVKKHLGEEAFVEESKNIKRYKDGLIPDFNFTGVT
ncbi:hypothetical protein GZH47_09265 [Paenibacillus rhizovicinus]|uniref:Uncharacterized protein n=1 Tax=Paenibacillus rhizovicinus TaxID=2704463 RepID=A0A6C0NXQ2_9BACL|nr:hypothetical protein [Paenibacillus rhizovicinus]QHW31024.1 hypothetical protein GZH47_09265 [Paenibacillus rhizovicinus]